MTKEMSTEVALTRLCEQARAVINPQLDASTIEAAVLARVARSNSDSLVVPRRAARRFLVPVAALAAAAIALVAAFGLIQRTRSNAGVARGQLANEPGMDGTLILPGQILEASASDLTVKHGAIVTWRLRAPGRVRVVETGSRTTLALERGRVDADVTPQHQPEVLAIEVEQLRVAVHGTVFSVERRGDVAEVVVREGKVHVSSKAGNLALPGQLLTAPSHVGFDVRPEQASAEPWPIEVKRPAKPTHPVSAASVRPVVAAPTPSVEALAERPSAAEIEHIWEASAREVANCFAAQPGGDPTLRVSFATQVQLRIAPDGTVSVAGFVPPVPPTVLRCAEGSIATLHAAPTEVGASVSRPKVLTR